MLRLLHVIDSLTIGGTEWQCLSLAGHLNQEGYTSQIVCFNPGGPFLETARLMGLRLEVVPFSGFRRLGVLKSLVRLATFMKRQRIQLVQSYGFYSNAPALLAGRMAGVPLSMASRRDMGESLSKAQQVFERGIMRLADRVVVNAEAIKGALVTAGQVREEKIVLIPTGVDLDT